MRASSARYSIRMHWKQKLSPPRSHMTSLRGSTSVRWDRSPYSLTEDYLWQAYPGHEPCPIPVPDGLRGQWDGWHGKEENRALLRENLAIGEKVLSDSRFPQWLLDRKILRLAVWFTRLGLSDYSYLFKAAQLFTRYSA